jgi:hypothetical protein
LQVEVNKAAVQSYGKTNARLIAELNGQTITGNLAGVDELGVSFGGTFDAQLAGHALHLESWRDALGTAELRLLGVQLAGLELLAPNILSSIEGEVGTRLLVQRADAAVLPNIFLEVGVTKLAGAVRIGDEQRILPSVNPYFSAVYDGRERRMHASGVINDEHGMLLNTTMSIQIDPTRFVGDSASALRELRTTPLSVALTLPRRSFARIPMLNMQDQLQGEVEVSLALYDTLEAPSVSLLAGLHDVSIPHTREGAPVTLQLDLNYVPRRGDFEANLIGSSMGRSVLLSKATGSLPLAALESDAAWKMDAVAMLDKFPLRVAGPLADMGIRGTVSGRIDLSTATRTLLAQLDFNRLSSGRALLGEGALHVKGEPGALLANFSLARERRSLNVKLGATADSAQLPLPHQIQKVNIAAKSQDFDAAAFAPLFDGILARVSGDLNSNLTLLLVKQSPKAGELPTWESTLEGNATLTNGTAHIEAVGLELREIGASMSAQAIGKRSVISLTALKAKARSEEVNVEGEGEFVLEGAQLVSGSSALTLRSVPIAIEGQSLGTANARAVARFQRTKGWDGKDPHEGKDFMLVEIDFDQGRLKAARTASRELIDIQDNPDITILQLQTGDASPRDLMPLRFVVTLQQDVVFSLAELNIPMTGTVYADYTGKTRVTGAIQLSPGGHVPILGKVFEVTSGRVILNPDEPGNPAVNINLAGRSDRGELVFLNIAGTLSEPITEPPPSELQSLLGGAGNLVSGGVQALGINDLLGDSVPNIEFRVRSSQEQEELERPSYAAAVQIGQSLWFEGAYQRGQANTLNKADSESNLSGTVDYRFHPNWSLKTQVGTTGGGLDLQWQYRY